MVLISIQTNVYSNLSDPSVLIETVCLFCFCDEYNDYCLEYGSTIISYLVNCLLHYEVHGYEHVYSYQIEGYHESCDMVMGMVYVILMSFRYYFWDSI